MVVTAGLFGLLTALAWGVGEFWTTRVVKTFGSIHTLAAVNTLIAVMYGAYYNISFLRSHPDKHQALWHVLHPHLPAQGVLYALVAGALLALGEVGVYKAYDIGPINLVSPLASVYPLATTVLAMTAFRAHLSSQQMIGIGIILAGVMIASGMLGKPDADSPRSRRGPFMAIFGAATWGVAFALLAQASLQLGWRLATLIELCTLAYVSINLLPLAITKEVLGPGKFFRALTNKFMVGAAALQMCGYVTLALGGAGGATASTVVSAVSACYPALTVLLAVNHYKEKASVIPLMGAFTGMVGVVVLTLG